MPDARISRNVRIRSQSFAEATAATATASTPGTRLEQNNEWSLNRRYVQLEGLQTLSDSVPTRLSAAAH